jgi:hypothetical protein
MPTDSGHISVTAPLTPAFARVGALLFRPFDFHAWLVFGFCAWLDQLGRFGGGGGGGTGFHTGNAPQAAPFGSMLRDAMEYIVQNLYWLVPTVLGVGAVALGIWLAIVWVSSRGQFMFLHSVATSRPEIGVPWRVYSRHANSLFIFRACLGAAAFVLFLPITLLSLWMIMQLISAGGPVAGPIVGLVVVGLTGLAVGLAFLLVRRLTRDFVVPIMYLRTARSVEGWRQLSGLLARYPMEFFLYVLFSIVLSIAVGAAIFALVIGTCCLAGCLLIIPYVGTVLLLPIHVFVRSYSAAYLAQFGPEWNVFAPPPAAQPTELMPPSTMS